MYAMAVDQIDFGLRLEIEENCLRLVEEEVLQFVNLNAVVDDGADVHVLIDSGDGLVHQFVFGAITLAFTRQEVDDVCHRFFQLLTCNEDLFEVPN